MMNDSYVAENWPHHYEDLKRKTQSTRKTGAAVSKLQLLEFDERWNGLDKALKTIQEAPMEYEVCSSELGRRILILDNLKKSISLIRRQDQSNIMSSTTTNENGEQYTTNPIHISDAALVQQQRDQMKNQDMMILNIEQGVNRLHEKALVIGEETKIQSRMLDDLDIHVDVATIGLKEEAKHAEEVKEKGKVCYMYICAAIEIIVLFILILIMVMKPSGSSS